MEAAGDAMDDATDKAGEMADDAMEAAGDAMDDAKGAAGEMADDAMDAAKGVEDAVMEKKDDVDAALKDAMKD